jgi:hypothetical protein
MHLFLTSHQCVKAFGADRLLMKTLRIVDFVMIRRFSCNQRVLVSAGESGFFGSVLPLSTAHTGALSWRSLGQLNNLWRTRHAPNRCENIRNQQSLALHHKLVGVGNFHALKSFAETALFLRTGGKAIYPTSGRPCLSYSSWPGRTLLVGRLVGRGFARGGYQGRSSIPERQGKALVCASPACSETVSDHAERHGRGDAYWPHHRAVGAQRLRTFSGNVIGNTFLEERTNKGKASMVQHGFLMNN